MRAKTSRPVVGLRVRASESKNLLFQVFMAIYLIVAAIAYLLGSIPFGYILLRVFRGEDVRQYGSGNIGATNVARKAPGLGIATLVLDALKGYAAVAVGMQLANVSLTHTGITGTREQVEAVLRAQGASMQGAYLVAAIAAVFAILGHVFPIWLKFKGGKGAATGVGAFAALAPKAVLVVLVIFALLVAAFRYISLGSIVATAAFPVCAWLLYRNQASPAVFAAMVAAAAIIILKHHQNIRRLLAGTEQRFELKHR
jgi:glycerol-3-phosphate acyltransferase PlsY